MRVVCNEMFEEVDEKDKILLKMLQDIFVHVDWLVDSISNYRPVAVKRSDLLWKKFWRTKKEDEEETYSESMVY